MRITATHIGTVTHSVECCEWEYDEHSVVNALARLFRKFDLPNGEILVVEGYGKTIRCEHDGFLFPVARKLLS
jgi:hypothetical protein